MPQYRLYSPRQIFLASFIGSPLAASWFAASNHRSLSRGVLARRRLVGGAIATAVLMAIAFVLPERGPKSSFPLLYSPLIYVLAQAWFSAAFAAHLK
jgi:hypothetical protein